MEKSQLANEKFKLIKFGFSESMINWKESVFDLNIPMCGVLSYSTITDKFFFNDVELRIKSFDDLSLFISFFKSKNI